MDEVAGIPMEMGQYWPCSMRVGLQTLAEKGHGQNPCAAPVPQRLLPISLVRFTPHSRQALPLASRGHPLPSPPPHPSLVAWGTAGFLRSSLLNPCLSRFPEKPLAFRSRPRPLDPTACSLGLVAERPPAPLWLRGAHNSSGDTRSLGDTRLLNSPNPLHPNLRADPSSSTSSFRDGYLSAHQLQQVKTGSALVPITEPRGGPAPRGFCPWGGGETPIPLTLQSPPLEWAHRSRSNTEMLPSIIRTFVCVWFFVGSG